MSLIAGWSRDVILDGVVTSTVSVRDRMRAAPIGREGAIDLCNHGVVPTQNPGAVAEERLREYLQSLGYAFDYEATIGTHRPDFKVDSPWGTVVLEVHEPRAAPPPNRVGALDPYAGLRKAINRKVAQGAGAKSEGWPYVLVLGTSRYHRPVDEISVPGAMFGNLTVTFPVGPGAPTDPDVATVFGRDGRLRDDLNTRLSAVAVIRRFKPGQREPDEAVARQVGAGAVLQEIVCVAVGVEADLRKAGALDPRRDQTRLDVFHNPYARQPVPLDFFCGLFDQQWHADIVSGAYDLVAMGRCFNVVPN